MAFRIMTAAEWGRTLTGPLVPMGQPASYWIIHHSAGTADRPLADELRIINAASQSEGKVAIDYSFLINRKGEIGEGRGWSTIGAHTGAMVAAGLPRAGESYNHAGHAICMVGNYHPDFTPVAAVLPTEIQLDAAAWLMSEGVRLGHVYPDWRTVGHRETKPTACPGDWMQPKVPIIHARAHELLEADMPLSDEDVTRVAKAVLRELKTPAFLGQLLNDDGTPVTAGGMTVANAVVNGVRRTIKSDHLKPA